MPIGIMPEGCITFPVGMVAGGIAMGTEFGIPLDDDASMSVGVPLFFLAMLLVFSRCLLTFIKVVIGS